MSAPLRVFALDPGPVSWLEVFEYHLDDTPDKPDACGSLESEDKTHDND